MSKAKTKPGAVTIEVAKKPEPPKPTVDALGQKGTLFREGPPPVYLLTDGRFVVNNAGQWIAKPSLKSMEAYLLKRGGIPELLVFQPADGRHNIGYNATSGRTLVDVKEGRFRFKGHNTASRPYGAYYVFDAEIAKQFDALNKEEANFEDAQRKKWKALEEQLTRVTEGNFVALAAKQAEAGKTPAEEDD